MTFKWSTQGCCTAQPSFHSGWLQLTGLISAPGLAGTRTNPIFPLRLVQGLLLQTKAAALSWDDEAQGPPTTGSKYPF